MEYSKLQDRIYKGLGIVARQTGIWSDAFRPIAGKIPLDPEGRFLRLPVVLEPLTSWNSLETTEQVLWQGIFDGAYTRVGDYIVSEGKAYFIAAQEPLQPIVCIRSNQVISISRSPPPSLSANNAYGGYSQNPSNVLLEQYPAAVLIENKTGPSKTGLPTDQSVPYWTVLLSKTSDIILSSGDTIRDGLGRAAIVTYAQSMASGWRLIAKVSTT
jgi:hypothetical protein